MESLKQCPEIFDCKPHEVSLGVGPVPSYVSIVSGLFSCAGSVLIIIAYALFKSLRNSVAQTIVTHLAVADFFYAVGVIIGGINYLVFHYGNMGNEECVQFGTICVVQSYVTQWTSIVAYIWTAVLSVNFLIVYVWPSKHHFVDKSIPYLTVFAWLFPLTFLIPLLVLGRLGYSRYGASNWCYVKSGNYSGSILNKSEVIVAIVFANWIWQLLSIAVVIFSIIVVLIYTYVNFKKDNNEHNTVYLQKTMEKAERRLILIPILYVIIHIWDTIQILCSFFLSSEVHQGCTSSKINTVFLILGILQGIGGSSQGWVDVLLYVFASKFIRNKLFWQPAKTVIKKLTNKSQQAPILGTERSPLFHTEFSEVALPQDVTATVTYPSETYTISAPYTSIGQRST